MTRQFRSLLAATVLAAGCSGAPPEQALRDSAADALGGEERVRAVSTIALEGRGRTMNLGQDMTWDATGQAFELSEVRRVLDLSGPRAVAEETRTPNFSYFRGSQPQRQITGFDDGVAYAVTATGTASRQSASVARDRRAEFYHHPLTLVHAMFDPATTVSSLRAEGEGQVADVRIGDVTYTVTFGPDGRPIRIASPSYHPNLGDVTLTTEFAEYEPVDGLMLPRRLTTRLDSHLLTELTIERQRVNDSAVSAAPPPDVASAAEPAPASPRVEATEVTDGVWLLAGQSHHSALIEFADHLTLFEAPQSEARALAVIAKARELVPDKPLTELVLSHHHFDHSGGLRAAVAEGLAVITHEGNAAFVKEMVERPHTRQPDALQKNPRELTLRTVDGPTTLQDASMTMVLYPLPGNPHGETMVMAYLPRHRLVIEVDAYSPGGTYHPYAANLLETIRAHKLAVDRIVPLHGEVETLDDLVKAVAAQE